MYKQSCNKFKNRDRCIVLVGHLCPFGHFVYKKIFKILLVCLSICLFIINVKNAEPSGPKFVSAIESLTISNLNQVPYLEVSLFIAFLMIVTKKETCCGES